MDTTAKTRTILTDTAYVAVGAADKAAQLVRTLPQHVERTRKDVQRFVDERGTAARTSYEGYATRGRKLVTEVRQAEPTKRTIAQAETARTQVRDAVTNLTKAIENGQEAVETAAGRLGLRRSGKASSTATGSAKTGSTKAA